MINNFSGSQINNQTPQKISSLTSSRNNSRIKKPIFDNQFHASNNSRSDLNQQQMIKSKITTVRDISQDKKSKSHINNNRKLNENDINNSSYQKNFATGRLTTGFDQNLEERNKNYDKSLYKSQNNSVQQQQIQFLNNKQQQEVLNNSNQRKSNANNFQMNLKQKIQNQSHNRSNSSFQQSQREIDLLNKYNNIDKESFMKSEQKIQNKIDQKSQKQFQENNSYVKVYGEENFINYSYKNEGNESNKNFTGAQQNKPIQENNNILQGLNEEQYYQKQTNENKLQSHNKEQNYREQIVKQKYSEGQNVRYNKFKSGLNYNYSINETNMQSFDQENDINDKNNMNQKPAINNYEQEKQNYKNYQENSKISKKKFSNQKNNDTHIQNKNNNINQYSFSDIKRHEQKYCQDIYITEEKIDPNGEKYDSNELATKKQRDQAKTIRDKLSMLRDQKQANESIKKMLNENEFLPYVSERPYTKMELSRHGIYVFVYGIISLAFIVYGFLIAQDFEKMNQQLKCGFLGLLDEIINGTEIGSYEWIGISNMSDSLQDMIQNLDQVADNQQTYFSGSDYIENDLEALNYQNQGIYDYYEDKKIPESPNPAKPAGSQSESLYINDDFGPLEQEQTSSYYIQSSLDKITSQFANVLLQVVDSSESITLSVDTIKQQLGYGQKIMKSSTVQFASYLAESEERLNEFDSYIDSSSSIILIFYSIQAAGAFFSFIGVILTHCTGQRPKCRIFLHLGWFLMSFMLIIGLALSTALVPIGIMVTETCSWMDIYLNDVDEFNDEAYTFLPQVIKQQISVCKFGDGDLSTLYNIDNELILIETMVDSINQAKQLEDQSSDSYINLDLTPKIIQEQIEYIEEIQDGSKSDSDETGDDNPQQSLYELNQWADYSLSGSYQKDSNLGNCQVTQDQYVFNKNNCTSGYSLYDPNINNVNYNYGSKTCLVISDLDLLDQASRYATISLFCDNKVQIKLQSYFNALYKFDMARTSFFGALISDYDDLQTDVKSYNTKLSNFVDTIDDFSKSISDFMEVSSGENGLFNQNNCTFVQNSIDRLYDATCVNYVTPTFKIIICLAAGSLCMMSASLFSYCLAIKYARKFRKAKVEPSDKDLSMTPDVKKIK
ncbi:hypothetical protein PPERSA_01454 [Pseudocohnilembus persalinus]|uniref:Transmembrane protein n=1 Tax=Pseudocohnilembus persalinus TaxID=266149 RepID=A0A0V0QH52_PSEPJ|nr:hypothetical protein PPERSA_01454 [Pseudocohnilembus persalinus]|eukprot:KRX01551.1 hypothetical protein PPERSA_01454 [Pseudocohnilembus persalinus]